MAEVRLVITGVDRASPAFRKLERTGRSAFDGLKRNWLAVSAAFAGGILAIKKLTGAFAEFEKNIAEVSTLIDTSKVSMKEFEDQILKMAPKLGKGPAELAKGLYQVISAGVDTSEAMSVLEVSSKAAVAGLTDTFTAVDIITTALNAYGLQASEAARVSDILFTTVRLGKTTFTELASSLGQVLPFTSQLGISLEEVSAAMATLTAAGLSTEIATTALRALTVSFIQNAGKWKDAGVDIMQVIGDEGIVGAMNKLKEITGGNIQIMQQFIPETRALAAGLNLAGSGSVKFSKNLIEAKNATGATELAFGKMSQTVDFLWKQSMANLDTILIKIGKKSMPVVTVATRGAIVGLNALAENIDNISLMLGGAVAGIAALGLASLPAIVGSIGTAVTALGAAAVLTIPQIALLGAAFAGLLIIGYKAGEGIDALVYKLTRIDISGLNKVKEIMNDIANNRVPELVTERQAGMLEDLGFKGASAMKQFNMAVQEGILIYDQAAGVWVNAAQQKTDAIIKNTDELKTHYSALQSLHKTAIDQMKTKSQELLNVEQQIRNTRMTTEDLILSVRQKSMTESEKYNSTIENIEKKRAMASELSGAEQIILLESIQQQWARNTEAVIESGAVVVSAATVEQNALQGIKSIGEQIAGIQEKKKSALKEEIQIWDRVKSEALDALNSIKDEINDLPLQQKLDLDVSAALQGIALVKRKLAELRGDPVETTVEMKATGSPTMPFSEYMDYAKDKIQDVGGTVKTMIDFEGFSGSMDRIVAAATSNSKYTHGGQTYMDVGRLSNSMKDLGFPSGTFDLGLSMADKKRFSMGSLIPTYAWEWDRIISNSLSRAGRSYAKGTSYVPETGPYVLHKGEEVIPANQSSSSHYYNNARQEFKFIFNGSPRENAIEVERILKKRAKYNRSEYARATA